MPNLFQLAGLIKNYRRSLAVAGITLGLIPRLAFADVSVILQPQNPISFVGSNVTFTAQTTATGGETITGYTWKESANGQPPFITITGATTANLTIANVQTANSGSYFVSVTYNSGANSGLTAVSTLSTLTVEDQARITVQPSSQFRPTGGTAALTVSALGAQPLTYQWRENGANLSDGGRISGSTTGSLTISNLLTSDSGSYSVLVGNTYATATSQNAVLTVLVPPSIVTEPADESVLTGSNAVLSVTAAGDELSYAWFDGTNLVANGGRISGATSNVLTITGALTNDDGMYSVIVSSPVGSVTSSSVNLSVLFPPIFTSSTNASGEQGAVFNFAVTAMGSIPITFGADALPDGLTINTTNGVISGTPTVSGVFDVTLYATNAAVTASTNLLISLISGIPGITSSTNAFGQQGMTFTYTIMATNGATSYTAVGLPPGLNLDPVTGIISGPSLLSGTFPVTISAVNQFGAGSELLTLTLATGAPVITSKLTVSGTENNASFSYTITASNSPMIFGAIGLPTGLVLNPTNGVISGTPSYGGTNNVIVTAANAYGVGSNTVSFAIAYAKITSITIANVANVYSKPYLLDFTFSLLDNNGNEVIRPPEQLSVQCLEGNIQDLQDQYPVPLGDETASIVSQAISSELFKTFFVLDYSYSMFATTNAIADMQSSVEALINQEPASAQFGVVEFSADYIPPQLVTGFTSDKALLTQDINGIQTNFVDGNYAGTRFYDAMATAISNFTTTGSGEQHYLVVMSDGYDDSSVLATTTNLPTQADVVVSQALLKNVKIYCVGFGPNPNTNILLQLTSETSGQYYAAATPADLTTQFALLLKNLNSQYLLRWATLQRGATFQPMFTVAVPGVAKAAAFNTNFVIATNMMVDNTMTPPVTNITYTNISLVPLFTPPTYAGNVQQGILQLIPDSDTNVSSITLRAFYVPRYVREIQVHYQSEYPCTPSLLSDGPGDILSGWTLTQTNDGAGGAWLNLSSPNPTNAATSLPYGVMSDLVKFQFNYQALPNGSNVFSQFVVDNTIYSNLPPSGQSFVLSPTNQLITNYPPTPPFGTPIPWLISYGFTNNFTNAEVQISSNGLPVWQDYIAGLNPNDPTAKFVVQTPMAIVPGQPPVITFNSILGRTYRVDAATTLGNWVVLQDNISGTGGPISITDGRNLSGVNAVFYRVVVFYY